MLLSRNELILRNFPYNVLSSRCKLSLVGPIRNLIGNHNRIEEEASAVEVEADSNLAVIIILMLIMIAKCL